MVDKTYSYTDVLSHEVFMQLLSKNSKTLSSVDYTSFLLEQLNLHRAVLFQLADAVDKLFELEGF